jgi:predicted DNA binding protein
MDAMSYVAGVLRLAHGMGYYNDPWRIGTWELARILKMDKGTAGDRIRRAEKHVMD